MKSGALWYKIMLIYINFKFNISDTTRPFMLYIRYNTPVHVVYPIQHARSCCISDTTRPFMLYIRYNTTVHVVYPIQHDRSSCISDTTRPFMLYIRYNTTVHVVYPIQHDRSCCISDTTRSFMLYIRYNTTVHVINSTLFVRYRAKCSSPLHVFSLQSFVLHFTEQDDWLTWHSAS
jgi:hypothetical protein